MEHTGRYFHRQETVCGNFLLKKESVQTCQNGLYRVIQVIRPTSFRRARKLLLVSDKRSHVRRAMIEEECCYRPHAYVTLSIISGCFPRFSVPQVVILSPTYWMISTTAPSCSLLLLYSFLSTHFLYNRHDYPAITCLGKVQLSVFFLPCSRRGQQSERQLAWELAESVVGTAPV